MFNHPSCVSLPVLWLVLLLRGEGVGHWELSAEYCAVSSPVFNYVVLLAVLLVWSVLLWLHLFFAGCCSSCSLYLWIFLTWFALAWGYSVSGCFNCAIFMQVTVLTNVALSFESKHFWLDFHCFYINPSVFDAAQSICMLVFSDLWLWLYIYCSADRSGGFRVIAAPPSHLVLPVNCPATAERSRVWVMKDRAERDRWERKPFAGAPIPCLPTSLAPRGGDVILC